NNTATTCFGDCDGTANVAVTGGVLPFTFLWDDPGAQATASAAGLCAGPAQVMYTDANGCSDSSIVTIVEPADIITSITGMVQNGCFGDCLGTATVGITSGGVGPFVYSWNDPAAQATTTAVGLCAGSYDVMVTDANLCTSTPVTATITEPAGTILTMSAVNASCGATDGSAIVSGAGGVQPYTYLWNDPGAQITDTASGLGFGVYTVILTDFNGCSRTDSVSVNNVGAPTLSAVVDSNVTCFGLNDGVATATASGGTPPIAYAWNDPAAQTTATANGLVAGNYTVTVSDLNTCNAVAFITITEPSLLAGIITVTDVTCNTGCNGQGAVVVTGGTMPYAYIWNDVTGSTTSTSDTLCFGVRTCTITDSNSCVIALSDSVNEPGKLFTAFTSVNETCSALNGQALGAASGGTTPHTYLWNDPLAQTTIIANGLAAGTYTAVITDANGCSITDSISLTNTDVTLNSLASTNANCGTCDGMASASATGGTTPYNYSWNTVPVQATDTATALCAGTYTVVLVDGAGCTKTGTVTITEPAGFSATSTVKDVLCGGICDGESTVTPGGGIPPYTYLWDDSLAQTTPTATGLCKGTQIVTITDSAGCSVMDTVTIGGPNALSVSSSSVNATLGNNDGSADAATLGGVQPLTYLWDDTNAQTTSKATGLAPGTYTVTVTDGNGCTATSTAIVGQDTTPGMWDLELGARFDVYPNPTTGAVIFDLELMEVSGVKIQIINLMGQLVHETTFSSVQLLKKETNLSDLSDGVYFISLTTEKGSLKRRIVVSK
ncbi:MAG: T9SS type A sorting domain-containing protein, partial [Flavobacteriales bacterium]|nr:T9SS type A sorting domain-containing protein [Flavobacteriales bacterium]